MRISEVAKILNIPVQTIRFYEQQGIVAPARIGDGGYREYEPWDVFYLGECMMYRNMGLTVGEIKKVLHEAPVSYLSEWIKKKLTQIKEKRAVEMLMERFLIDFDRKIEVLPYNVGKFWIKKSPELAYYAYLERNGGQYSCIEGKEEKRNIWNKHMPLVHGIQMVSLDSIRDEKARDYDVWIVAVEKELMPILRIPMEEDVQTIPEEICLVTVLDAGERGQLSVDRYREIVKQAELQGYKPNGDILSCLLARCWDNGAYHRYFEVFIPPEKSTKRHFCTTRLPVQTKKGPALYKAAPSKIRQYIAKPPSLFISEGGFMWSG